ncbi:MAG: hypothetical protein IPK68_13310 [Bdellovibrionales bacterium]|nr:hypothetical protein [Bdellovibrionales bacterium]
MKWFSTSISPVLLRVLPRIGLGLVFQLYFGLASADGGAKATKAGKSDWSGILRYSVLTDAAQEVTPRSYTHVLLGDLEYSLNSSWSLGGNVSFRAGTVGDQIYKGPQQSKGERINPEAGLVLNYELLVFGNNSLKFLEASMCFWMRAVAWRDILGFFARNRNDFEFF